jgi:hypothetical protein
MIPRKGTRDSPVISRRVTVLPNHGTKELTILANLSCQPGMFGTIFIFSSMMEFKVRSLIATTMTFFRTRHGDLSSVAAGTPQYR